MARMSLSLSLLDLVPVGSGQTAAEAVRGAARLARHAEALGLARVWYAEHHGMPSVASSSPEVLIAHVAARTERIRVGSGGVMLPNHAPLRVAEAFRTLEALHPGRIDLGMGRAPGSDATASRALRAADGEHFPQLLQELQVWSEQLALPDDHPMAELKAMPTGAPLPPIWLLGSSGASARMAGESGMGYAFASHFSPSPPGPAIGAYRAAFRPSAAFERPHAILGVSVMCAPTAEEAEHLAQAMDLAWVRIRRGRFLPLPTPEEALAHPWTDDERALVRAFRRLVAVGDPSTVAAELRERAQASGANEVMLACNFHDAATRERCLSLIVDAVSATASPAG
jgi:luciferase family oxidoreductase group 1